MWKSKTQLYYEMSISSKRASWYTSVRTRKDLECLGNSARDGVNRQKWGQQASRDHKHHSRELDSHIECAGAE